MSRDFTCSHRIFKKMTFRSDGTPKSCTATTEVFAEDRLLGSSEEEEKKNNNLNLRIETRMGVVTYVPVQSKSTVLSHPPSYCY